MLTNNWTVAGDWLDHVSPGACYQRKTVKDASSRALRSNSWDSVLVQFLYTHTCVLIRSCITANGTPSHSYGVWHAMWDHTVLSATQHKWTLPALTSIYLPWRDGRLSWPGWLVTYRDGLTACRRSPIPVLTRQRTAGSQTRDLLIRSPNAITTTLPSQLYVSCMWCVDVLWMMCPGFWYWRRLEASWTTRKPGGNTSVEKSSDSFSDVTLGGGHRVKRTEQSNINDCIVAAAQVLKIMLLQDAVVL